MLTFLLLSHSVGVFSCNQMYEMMTEKIATITVLSPPVNFIRYCDISGAALPIHISNSERKGTDYVYMSSNMHYEFSVHFY